MALVTFDDAMAAFETIDPVAVAAVRLVASRTPSITDGVDVLVRALGFTLGLVPDENRLAEFERVLADITRLGAMIEAEFPSAS